jgi:hypothetical protein
VNAWASCDAGATISPTPAAANKKAFLMVCHLRFRLSPGAQKSVFRRDTQSTPAASIRYAIGRLGHPSGLQDRSFESEQFCTDRWCQVR